jgi:hypothetical protein
MNNPAQQPKPQQQPDNPGDDRRIHERPNRRPQQHQPDDQRDDADDRRVHAQRPGQPFDKISARMAQDIEQATEAIDDKTDDRTIRKNFLPACGCPDERGGRVAVPEPWAIDRGAEFPTSIEGLHCPGGSELVWRGSLLPLECAALTKGAATQPGASKLARHISSAPPESVVNLWRLPSSAIPPKLYAFRRAR